jgi:hypothetical protein
MFTFAVDITRPILKEWNGHIFLQKTPAELPPGVPSVKTYKGIITIV